MKELSVEEKAKRYDSMFERLKEMYNNNKTNVADRLIYERYFPELKESENKRMIQYFKDLAPFDKADELYEKYGFSHKDAIAWLEKQGEHSNFLSKIQVGDKVTRNEDGVLVNLSQLNRVAKKQGEQKPADKIEPKFKVGDWIITNKNHIWYVDETPETTSYLYRLINQYGKVEVAEFEVVDKKARLWTIQDAKDGDVLADGNLPFIFKKIDSMMHSYAYCGISVDSGFKIESEGEFGEWTWAQDIKPATKEQRDQLEKAMADAGYTFDFEKKELKKIIVPIFNIGDTIVKKHNSDIYDFSSFTITDITGGKYWYNDRIICDITEQDDWELVEQKPIQEIEPFKAEHGKYYYCIKDYFCGGKKQASKGDVVQALRGLAIMGLKDASEYFLPVNFIKCNSAWSEEDEENRKNILYILNQLKGTAIYKEDKTAENCIDWLKSLKGRVQPKQEWSEGDEQMFEHIIEKATLKFSGWNCLKNDEINFLKSLHPQNKQEWTQDDIDMIDWLIRCCEKEHEELCNDRYGHQDIVSDLKRDCRKKWDWLESLKEKVAPQTTWKPSEEQMDALLYITKHYTPTATENLSWEALQTLELMLEQLKKLKEE